MKSHLTLATSAVTFAAIVACSDAGRPVGPSRPATALVQPESAESGELEALDRFALDVSVTGAFTPNGPINVHAVARSVIPTAEAEVTITFPQVEVARLGNWSFSRSPVGQRIEPAARNIASFGANGTTVIDATVSIPVAGYYEAIVSVAKRSGEGDWFDGKPVHDVLRKSVWFVVDPQRGRQTDGFDPASLPETWLATGASAAKGQDRRPVLRVTL